MGFESRWIRADAVIADGVIARIAARVRARVSVGISVGISVSISISISEKAHIIMRVIAKIGLTNDLIEISNELLLVNLPVGVRLSTGPSFS